MATPRGAGKVSRLAARQKPRLPDALASPGRGPADWDVWDGVHVTTDVVGRNLAAFELTASRWSGARLTGTTFRGVQIRDTVFDLSGTVFERAAMARVEFRDCRMSGVVFAGARLDDVLFAGCRLDGANFRGVAGDRTRFVECELADATFLQAELSQARMYDCGLGGVELTDARLAGLHLHGSEVRGLKGVAALRGAVIHTEQLVPMALEFLAAAGVEVRDERDDNP
jgi:uncharacterized protein YjbI with pentapeptide repeats